MPPRYSYWTILAGGLPTSFRAADRDDLLPTLRRLQERHPDAEMKWFQRGKVWDSPEAALAELRKPSVTRSRDWRPGGEHRDPREPFQKAKRDRNQARRQRRFDHKQSKAAPGDSRQDQSAGPKLPFDPKHQPRQRRFEQKQRGAAPEHSGQERSPAHQKPRFDAKNQARRQHRFDHKQSHAAPEDTRQERSPGRPKPRFDARRPRTSAHQAPKGGRRR